MKAEISISRLGKQGPVPRRRDVLRREIILALVVKILLITALWYAFFSEPVDDNLTGAQVGDVLFNSPLTDSAAQSITGSSKPIKSNTEEN